MKKMLIWFLSAYLLFAALGYVGLAYLSYDGDGLSFSTVATSLSCLLHFAISLLGFYLLTRRSQLDENPENYLRTLNALAIIVLVSAFLGVLQSYHAARIAWYGTEYHSGPEVIAEAIGVHMLPLAGFFIPFLDGARAVVVAIALYGISLLLRQKVELKKQKENLVKNMEPVV